MLFKQLRAFAKAKSVPIILGTVLVLGVIWLIATTGLNSRPRPDAPQSAIVSLVKQQDRYRVMEMVRNVEDRWNSKFHHDWVFLSEQDFDEGFKKTVSAFVSGNVHFRTINRKLHWKMPDHIDRNRVMNEMRDLEAQGVPYGGSLTYRLMCRFQAGLFVQYLPEYRYYARIDPDVKLYCDVNDDLFARMHHNDYKLAFTVALKEFPHAATNLSHEVNLFMQANPDLLHQNQWVDSFVKPWDRTCHMWSNFELGDLDFLRSAEYQKWFEHLEQAGGFFYNRWGDAPVITLGAALFLDPQQVHHFGDVGSYHRPNVNCPTDIDDQLKLRCSCPHDQSLAKNEQNTIFTYKSESCVPQFLQLQGKEFQKGWRLYADLSVKELADNSH